MATAAARPFAPTCHRAGPPARVAFLTSEFVSEDPRGGGLGHYVGRMARALVAAGH